MDSRHVDELGKARISQLILRYSFPTMLATVVNAVYNMADRIFVGRTCGEDAIAALTVCFSPTLFLLAIAMTVGHGSATMVSISLGKGDKATAEKYLGQAVFLFFCFYLFALAFGFTFMPQILSFFGATDKILSDACSYFSIIICGLIFEKISFGINNLIRAEGRPVYAMSTILIGGILNVIFDYIFLVKWGWGVKGAAYATILAQACGAIWVMIFYFSGKSFLRIRLENIRTKWATLKQMLAAGSPSFIIQFLAAMSVAVFVMQARKYGSESAIAVIGVCTATITLLFLPIVGLSMGIQPILGYNLGAGMPDRVKKTFFRSIQLATLICTSGFLLTEIFAREIFTLYLGKNSQLLSMGESALRTLVACFPLIGANIITSGYFQSLKRPRISIFITTLRQAIFLIPIMFILPSFIGIKGLWMCYPIADFMAFVATMYFVVREVKKLNAKIKNT